jgi:aspartyl-tRNA(Asn)/glutamyl-tRNA(Gln) amidotransferase subunit C
MAVSIEEVKHIAQLAKLKFTDEELQDFTHSFNDILQYMEMLNRVDTVNVPPLSHPVEMTNVFRDDVLKQSVTTEEALKNAPDSDEEFFKVPKVIG